MPPSPKQKTVNSQCPSMESAQTHLRSCFDRLTFCSAHFELVRAYPSASGFPPRSPALETSWLTGAAAEYKMAHRLNSSVRPKGLAHSAVATPLAACAGRRHPVQTNSKKYSLDYNHSLRACSLLREVCHRRRALNLRLSSGGHRARPGHSSLQARVASLRRKKRLIASRPRSESCLKNPQKPMRLLQKLWTRLTA